MKPEDVRQIHFKQGKLYVIGMTTHICSHATEKVAILLPLEGGLIYDQQTGDLYTKPVNFDFIDNVIERFLMPPGWLKGKS